MPIDPEQFSKAAEGAARSPFAAGFLGALVTAMRGMPGASWRERCAHSVSGAFMAGYLGPGISEWFGLTSPSLLGATAFLVGMFGLNASAGVWDYLKTASVLDWLPGFKRRGGD
jgi:hypothetical protein